MNADFVIVGAGINGCAAAYQLAREGQRVVVVERYAPAAMASGWTLAGVRQSGRDLAEMPLALGAVAIWPGLAEELGAPTGYRQEGNLRLARDDAEVARIRRMVDEQRKAGLELAFLPSNEDVREIAPALAPSILAASHCPTDGHADPVATVQAFRSAAERHGAVFRLGEQALSIETEGSRLVGVATGQGRIGCGGCIVAAGVHSNALLAPLGFGIPMRINMTTIVQSEPVPPLLKQVLGVAAADFAGRQQIDGRLRMSGGSRPWHGVMVDGAVPTVRPPADAISKTIEKAASALPALRDARIARFWAGLIDQTPDGLPVIERAPELEGLVIAAGFSGHGFGIGPMTSLVLRDLALGDEPRLSLGAFQRARFSNFSGDWGDVRSKLYG